MKNKIASKQDAIVINKKNSSKEGGMAMTENLAIIFCYTADLGDLSDNVDSILDRLEKNFQNFLNQKSDGEIQSSPNFSKPPNFAESKLNSWVQIHSQEWPIPVLLSPLYLRRPKKVRDLKNGERKRKSIVCFCFSIAAGV